MHDPENFVGQERDEARETRDHQPTQLARGQRNPYTGEWRDRPTRAEADAEKLQDQPTKGQ